MRTQVQSLALLSWLRIPLCPELWCRSQMQLTSCMAVVRCRLAAVALIRPLAWKPPYAMVVGLKDKKKKKKKIHQFWYLTPVLAVGGVLWFITSVLKCEEPLLTFLNVSPNLHFHIIAIISRFR